MLLDGRNWANLRLDGSNVFILKSKESRTINVYASTKTKLEGEQMFLVTVKRNSDIVKELQLKANVIKAGSYWLTLISKSVLQAVLIGLVVLLFAIGFFLAYEDKAKKQEAEEAPDYSLERETYY